MDLLTGHGDTGFQLDGSQKDYDKLFYSDPASALVVPITLMPGCGVLKAGTALALNGSAAGNVGKFFPYDPTATITGAETAPGRAYLVQDGAANNYIYMTMADSYKFIVGDNLYVVDADTAARDLGAITVIDRTTYTHMARLTVTNQVTTGYTTAQFAYVVVKGYDVCVGILWNSKDTGESTDSKGATGARILKNAVLYTGSLTNVDSAARTDLGATVTGQFTYL